MISMEPVGTETPALRCARKDPSSLSEIRPVNFTSPIPLFYGVHHSDGLFSTHHLMTLGTELPCAIALVLVARWIARRVVEPEVSQDG